MLQKRKMNPKVKWLLVPTSLFIGIYFLYLISPTLAIYKEVNNLVATLNITKPIYTIKLDSGDSTTSGTTAIYEKYMIGFYLNSNITLEMTVSNHNITVPTKDGYTFVGYYTETDENSTQVIDASGYILEEVGATFDSNTVLYAHFEENSTTLYDVLKNEATRTDIDESDRLATLYTGKHGDSMDTSQSTETIYHWYTSTSEGSVQILNKNNVVFAGYCWQMIRTTDTGGVKLLYNGEPTITTVDGITKYDCNTSTDYISKAAFNSSYKSPSYIGYMYNVKYDYQSKAITSKETILSSTNLSTNYYYYDDVEWGTPTASKWNGIDAFKISSTTESSDLVGKYTFKNSAEIYENTSAYYIVAVSDSTLYYVTLGSEAATDKEEYYNTSYTYGSSYIDNGDGTYTIEEPTLTKKLNWYSDYSDVNNQYVCWNNTTGTCSNLRYVSSTSVTTMNYMNIYKYSKSFTYNTKTKTYTLSDDDSIYLLDVNDTSKNQISNAHYTCWNAVGECTTISYVYYVSSSYLFYINLTKGNGVEEALTGMLNNDTVNKTNSNIKDTIETWYESNMTDYTEYLEDTIFCNDRSISNLGGWNPDGGSISSLLLFGASDGLSCNNETDKFSVSNEKAPLKYPVGLLTYNELKLVNQNAVNASSFYYWLGTPRNFLYMLDQFVAYVSHTIPNGAISSGSVAYKAAVRPSISLKTGMKYSSGDGSLTNPYIVDLNS